MDICARVRTTENEKTFFRILGEQKLLLEKMKTSDRKKYTKMKKNEPK